MVRSPGLQVGWWRLEGSFDIDKSFQGSVLSIAIGQGRGFEEEVAGEDTVLDNELLLGAAGGGGGGYGKGGDGYSGGGG